MSSSRQHWWESEATIESIRDYAIQSGLLIKASGQEGRAVNIPVTLLPSKFPQELFELAYDIAPGINSLIDAVSKNNEFLESTLTSAMQTDDFTRHLFEIHMKVTKSDVQTCRLVISRSDYMVESDTSTNLPRLRQIEINTIASGLFGMSQDRVQQFHKYVHSRYCSTDSGVENEIKIPPSTSLTSVAEGIASAWKEYPTKNSYVLFVVMAEEWNLFDQRSLEYELWSKFKIPCIRKTLTALSDEAYLSSDKVLTLKSGEEISVVYYRAGYCPRHYSTEREWDARLMLESSRATNCPMITYQLVGMKKVQQVLASTEILEKFVDDISMAKKIRSTFAGFYTLDMGVEGDDVIDKALKEPERFVAKPQREGGGNNFYDDGVRTLLKRIRDTEERGAYILMDRIISIPQPGFVLRSGANHTTMIKLVYELGIFGILVRKGTTELMNKAGGYLLRSKRADLNEGGVSAGYGALDTPDLLPQEQYIKYCTERTQDNWS